MVWKMRRSRLRVQSGALLTFIGSILGCRGDVCTTSSSLPSQLRPRCGTASSLRMIGNDDAACSKRHRRHLDVAPAAVLCTPRGGTVDDDHRSTGGGRRRDDDRDYNDSPPPRRYDDYGRDRGREPHRSSSRGFRDRRDGPSPGDRPGGRDRGYRYDDRDNFGVRPSGSGNGGFRGGRHRYDERLQRERSPEDDEPNVGKKKKWFSSKKYRATAEMKGSEQQQSNPDNGIVPPMTPPPPPPPPLDSTEQSKTSINPAETERTPIHYTFPTAVAAAEERMASDARLNDDELGMDGGNGTGSDALDVPYLDVEEEIYVGRDGPSSGRTRRRREGGEEDDFDDRYRASPRRDVVTKFMSTRRGALQVRAGSIIVGAALGGFIGKSLLNDPAMMLMVLSSILFLASFLRNDYGELSRALGLGFVFTLQRTRSVRKDYPTLPHIKAIIRQGPRKPFPPVEDGESPWKYEPIYRDDPEFKMTYALLAMALVGSFCGGNVNLPMFPQWIGGIAGAVAFASLTTGSNARGDLGRSMGMRIVGLVQLVLAINSELQILRKSATVGGLIFDKFMILDRKHRIKDRIVAICKWGYEKVSRTAEQVKEDIQDERPDRRERRR